MLKIYVAGSSKELDRCERVISLLREGGIEITHAWTLDVRAHGANVADDAILLPALRADMVKGVGRAEKVLVLVGGEPMRGALVELGGAFLTGVELHIAGDTSKEPWARALGQRFHATDDDAVRVLIESSRRW